mmetsp:Transcript_132049/g.422532  ORF Transcript_132049/g.422532 Transcript_132049/m.422532 type:complete len:306 (-) Transcript_132049:117-1034(-)
MLETQKMTSVPMSTFHLGRKWADLDEEDDEVESTRASGVGQGFETKADEHGIKTVIEYKERDGKTYKLTKRVKETVLTSWTNTNIQARTHMAKFGKAARSDAATERHLVVRSEEDIPVVLSTRLTAQALVKDEAEDKFYEESLTIVENLMSQKKAWTEINKEKHELKVGMEEPTTPADKPRSDFHAGLLGNRVGDAPKSTYVPPSLRGKENDPKGKGKGVPDEQCSLRVTNLSEDAKQGDLEELFGRVGRLARVYVAKDQLTGASRGFAFITYYARQDADRAIAKLNGHGYDNLILQVQIAKPRA